jgi:hypothetical protein
VGLNTLDALEQRLEIRFRGLKKEFDDRLKGFDDRLKVVEEGLQDLKTRFDLLHPPRAYVAALRIVSVAGLTI